MTTQPTRQYSLEVHGWASKDHDDRVFGLRSIRVVACGAEVAITRARKLLDPHNDYSDRKQWAVVSGAELSPEDAREWYNWHHATMETEK